MKNGLVMGILVSIFIGIIVNMDELTYFVVKTAYSLEIQDSTPNEFKKDDEFLFITHIEELEIQKKEQVNDIFYTFLNSGLEKFTFYCNTKVYPECIKDVTNLGGNGELLTDISNFVHPYNSHAKITTKTNYFGKIELSIEKNYTDTQIRKIERTVEQLIDDLITASMSDVEKIKTIHDFILKNASYDNDFLTNVSPYQSNIAYGPLFEGEAICSGYSDLMSIFLEKMGYKNYKVSSLNHVWNYVYVNNEWFHLDLTWDDPIVTNSVNYVILHNYFLITTAELEAKKTAEHAYNKNVFLEAK